MIFQKYTYSSAYANMFLFKSRTFKNARYKI